MTAIILINADDPYFIEVLQDDDGFNNLIFDSVEDADMWLQKNAECGWCTRIIDLD